MPIISRIGRRSFKARLLIFTIYALLISGAVTMLYPFGLMIAGSTKSDMDTPDADLVPGFMVNGDALWGKYLEGLFNDSTTTMQQVYFCDTPMFKLARRPDKPKAKLAAEWESFVAKSNLPFYSYSIGFLASPVSKTMPDALRNFKAEMARRFNGNIEDLNQAMGTDFVSWSTFTVVPESFLLRTDSVSLLPLGTALQDFKARGPICRRYYFTIEGFFRQAYLRTQYGRDIAGYNTEHGTSYASYDQVHLDRRWPSGPGRTDKERKDWETFVRTILNLLWIRPDPQAAPLYRQFLQAKYRTVEALNKAYGTQHASFEAVPLIAEPPREGLALSDWDAFVQGWRDPDTQATHILPTEMISIYSVDFLFRDYLKGSYGNLDEVNRRLGTHYGDWMDILPPQQDCHYLAFARQRGAARWEFIKRNYLAVIDYLVLHGRGIANTAIYCVLAVVGALIVNPLAAYALSRYKPRSTYKVLLFLMLTMTFPPMVTEIPAFLLLRNLHLLNTFAALILPGLANGYLIFLLKGFFDSLPQELYESASLDGAGEFRIFWQITMSLSKPILAVTALGAFTAAYSNFIFALLICQDESMWTLMVWLYQMP